MEKSTKNSKNYEKKRLINKKKAFKKGIWAEKLVKIILRLKGYAILETRYKRPVGEVDVIAKKGKFLVFIEVKARKSDHEAAESITPKQQQRIMRAAQFFVAENKSYQNHQMRFDACLVTGAFSMRHIQSAWTA